MHLHRAKYLPKGGPDGGDGGRGGNIYLRGNRNLWTLLHLRYRAAGLGEVHLFVQHLERLLARKRRRRQVH